MPVAGVVATQLTDHAQYPYSLVQNGVEVLRTRVPLESISLTESGPGSVSTLDYDFIDPTAAAALEDASEVAFYDLTNGVTLFRGWVDTYKRSPAYATGRKFSVSCVGVESLLDWTILPVAFTAVTPADVTDEIVRLVASLTTPLSYGRGATSTATTPIAYNLNDSALGVGGWGLGNGGAAPPVAVSAGTSLREAIRNLLSQAGWAPNISPFRQTGDIPPIVGVTVDFSYGLRVWGAEWGPDGSAHAPDDYTTLTVVDAVGGSKASTSLDYERHPGDIYREVYVAGSSAAATGWFGDGSGVRGRQGFISDPTNITSADLAAEFASQFLRTHGAGLRGMLTLKALSASSVATVRAGSLLDLTDAGLGVSGQAPISSITKTFNTGGTQNWSVAFGGLRPSAARLTRTLTRTARRWNTSLS